MPLAPLDEAGLLKTGQRIYDPQRYGENLPTTHIAADVTTFERAQTTGLTIH
jgi:hypothetical protein